MQRSTSTIQASRRERARLLLAARSRSEAVTFPVHPDTLKLRLLTIDDVKAELGIKQRKDAA